MSAAAMSATEAEVQSPAPVPAPAQPTVKMGGYLEKKGKMRVVSMWKRYWFVLEGRLLLYYKSQQEYARLSPCRGSLNMGLASCVRPGPGPDRDDGHVLEVVLRSHVVTLRARDRACQEQWLKALLDSMALPSVTSPGKDSSKGPLHFRYPSADNLNHPDQNPSTGSSAQSEKHRTLPNWRRSAAGSGPSAEDDVTPSPGQQQLPHVFAAPRKPDPTSKLSQRQQSLLERRGSILPMLPPASAVHPEGNHTPLTFGHKEAKKELSFTATPPWPKAKCSCKPRTRMSFREEEKENVGASYHPDENQNRLFSAEQPCDHHGQAEPVQGDLLQQSGVDLSNLSLEKQPSSKPVRCNSADELRSSSTSALCERRDEEMEVDYFSVTEIQSSSRGGPDSQRVLQRALLGDGEYVKYSEPEDCDKRDSTFSTTASSVNCEKQSKPKIRLRKRKGSSTKEGFGTYNLTDWGSGSAEKKRAPLRNRLSFLSRVLSHVRRPRPEDLMDHPATDQYDTNDSVLSSHPDMHTRCTTTVAAHLLTEAKKKDTVSHGPDASITASLKLDPSNDFPGEAPEEPPPDYDSVNVDPIEDPTVMLPDEPPQLPPRHMKRPRSPWHDVPTNNSPVAEMDGEARQRLLSAAKYGRVIGTREAHNMDVYDWGSTNADDSMQHHAYEVLSDNSPAGSNEHLAIYLSSESSDEEFHEEVVLRRKIEQNNFLFGSDGDGKTDRRACLGPLLIHTEDLPTLHSSGRVSLSHIEAVKLSLLIQAQKSCYESIRTRKKEEVDLLQMSGGDKCYDIKQSMESSTVSKEDCVREPPAEFADKNYLTIQKEEREKKSNELRSLPLIDSLANETQEENSDERQEAKSRNSQQKTQLPAIRIDETSFNNRGKEMPMVVGELPLDTPPQLPLKLKTLSKGDSETLKPSKHHSDELNLLLAQLANMTTAPLLPVGATCSLQADTAYSNDIDSSRKQSLSLDALVNNPETEPDYDVPRPHTSLLQFLSQEPFCNNLYNGPVRESPSSGQESPQERCISDDQHWPGHMSPDSLDIPLSVGGVLSRDVHSIITCDEQGFSSPKKASGKKDRSRRVTLNGPLIQHPMVSKQDCRESCRVRRNSAELSLVDVSDIRVKDCKINLERRVPKQISLTTSCEHNSNMHLQQRATNSTHVADLCKKFELSASLEDISEKSELERVESLTTKPDVNCLHKRNLLKRDEVDMDSLEITELKRLEMSELEPTGLISIVEECDVHSDSEKSDRTPEVSVMKSTEEISESASEGALICEGDSESRATDQRTNHSTDTDMDMSEDEENVKMEEDTSSAVLEPDSLLHEPIVTVKCVSESMTVEYTKDESLEADSLELKK